MYEFWSGVNDPFAVNGSCASNKGKIGSELFRTQSRCSKIMYVHGGNKNSRKKGKVGRVCSTRCCDIVGFVILFMMSG